MNETPAPQPPPRLKFFERLLDNPVILKELKGRMRGRQGFITLTVYLSLIAFFVTSIYLVFYIEDNNASPSYLQTVGKALFGTVVLLELLMIGFIGPALTSGAISAERERQTFDLLRISLLSASELVFGKLSSAVSFLLLLIFTVIPIQSLAFFLGGVGAAEMLIATLMLVVTAVFFCALGLFFSSFTKRTLTSTIITYGSHIFSFVFFFAILFITSMLSPNISSNSNFVTEVYAAFIWVLFSTNSFFAAIVSEVILVEDQAIFFTTTNIWGSASFPLPSPWTIYVIFHAFLSIALILSTIYFVRRIEK